jgi:hypothetical protein
MQVLRRMVSGLRSRTDFHRNHKAYERPSLLVGSLLKMAQSGDQNTSFGIYKNVCCGREIAISKGATFPVCPEHRHLPTEWIAIGESKQPIHLVVLPDRVMVSHSGT